MFFANVVGLIWKPSSANAPADGGGLEAMSKTQFVIIMNFTGHHHSESDA